MSKVRKFFANRDLREFDARLNQMEETLQQVLDFLSEPEASMELLHTGAGRYRVIQGDKIVFPPEGSVPKADCEAFMKARTEGGDVDLEDVAAIAENLQQERPEVSLAPQGSRTPEKLGSRDTDAGVERYVSFTDKTEMILTEEQFLKAKDGGLTALMEIVNGLPA